LLGRNKEINIIKFFRLFVFRKVESCFVQSFQGIG
jgi:hypothetical protein